MTPVNNKLVMGTWVAVDVRVGLAGKLGETEGATVADGDGLAEIELIVGKLVLVPLLTCWMVGSGGAGWTVWQALKVLISKIKRNDRRMCIDANLK